jgi:hypothetical protein
MGTTGVFVSVIVISEPVGVRAGYSRSPIAWLRPGDPDARPLGSTVRIATVLQGSTLRDSSTTVPPQPALRFAGA